MLVATPIGHLGDLSPRAAEALRAADVVAAEDTRRSATLLAHVGARVPLLAYHEHNEDRRTHDLLERVEGGATVVVVTDAGTPGVSDPGYVLVREAVARGIEVEAVPGPVAAIQALVLSGLPTDRFVFEGFLPRKAGPRRRRLDELAGERRTLVCYLAPHRAHADLTALAEACGADRPAALARELTKRYEEVRRGTLADLAEGVADGVRGELTLVVAGAPADLPPVTESELAARVQALIATGVAKKDAITQVAKAAGVPKRVVYDAVLGA